MTSRSEAYYAMQAFLEVALPHIPADWEDRAIPNPLHAGITSKAMVPTTPEGWRLKADAHLKRVLEEVLEARKIVGDAKLTPRQKDLLKVAMWLLEQYDL